MAETTITVYSFDYCNSSAGVWSREHHPTLEAAKASRQFWIDHLGWSADDEDEDGNPIDLNGDLGESDGTYGDITAITSAEYELSFEGIFKALNSGDPNE